MKITLPFAIENYNSRNTRNVTAEFTDDSVILKFSETKTSPRIMCVFKNTKHASDYLMNKSAKYILMKMF